MYVMGIYLTLCTFSFEINESRLSDTRCLIQVVVPPHCGDKRMARRCTKRSRTNYFVITLYHWNVTSSMKCSILQGNVQTLIQLLLFV